ncbi:MAG: hypothetical protein NUV53_01340 [Patescibacteria group bacterium]|nr:hypothetical protein [Patescibacteria group bacterium]
MNIHSIHRVGVVIAIAIFCVAGIAAVRAATNIDSTDKWAWNDIIGWVDFYATDSVTVTSQGLKGYASSTSGDISLDCKTTRSGDICSQSNYQVSNDGVGNLSNYGWNDEYGWISFDCNNTGGCGVSNYEVLIDANTGVFSGYAWNDIMGWISFNCSNDSSCGTSNYKVITSWVATSAIATLDSATFDTGVDGGAQINSVLWQGHQPSGTLVRFQFAISNASSGPWSYGGSDGTSNTYYEVDPNVSKNLDYILHSGNRYFRYRVILVSDLAQTLSPRVDDVLINWSP